MTPPRKRGRPKKAKESVPAEFPDDTEINGVANYEYPDPTYFPDRDPNMHYFFALKDGSHQGVEAMERKGYRKSSKAHSHPTCVLMEIPLDVWEKRQREQDRRNAELQRQAMKPPPGLEIQRPDHGTGTLTQKRGGFPDGTE